MFTKITKPVLISDGARKVKTSSTYIKYKMNLIQ